MLPLALFSLLLLATVITGGSIVLALLAGLAIFPSTHCGSTTLPHRLPGPLCRSFRRQKSAGGVCAGWGYDCRPALLWYDSAGGLLRREAMPAGDYALATFLLNAGVSLLIGTCFGTAATVGTVCAAVAASMGIDPALAGGAVLAGVFVGDRASPFSSGAILVSEITGTNLYDNVSAMLRRGLVPALLTCILYTMLGRSGGARAEVDLDTVFQTEFYLSWVLCCRLS